MEQAKAVGSKAWDVLVVDKVLSLESEFIVFFPVAADGQHVIGPFYKGNYVWQCNASLFSVTVFVFVAVQVQVNVALKDDVALVVQVTEPGLLVLGFLDVGLLLGRIGQLDVAVEPSFLELHDLVLGLAHHMGDAVAGVQVRGPVGQDDVFGGDEHRHLTPQAWVVVHLLERTARGRQAPQHALMLWPELAHHFCQLVVHVELDTDSGFLLLWGLLAQDFGTHRALRGEGLRDRLRLEAHHSFGNHRVKHARRAVPRLRALFVLEAQQFQPLCVGFLPVFAGVLVVLDVACQVPGQGLHGRLVHLLGQVRVELVLVFAVWADGQLQVPGVDVDFLGVDDLNLQRLFLCPQLFNALGLLVKRFVDIRCHVCP